MKSHFKYNNQEQFTHIVEDLYRNLDDIARAITKLITQYEPNLIVGQRSETRSSSTSTQSSFQGLLNSQGEFNWNMMLDHVLSIHGTFMPMRQVVETIIQKYPGAVPIHIIKAETYATRRIKSAGQSGNIVLVKIAGSTYVGRKDWTIDLNGPAQQVAADQ